MVAAALSPVALEVLEVEVEALDRGFAGLHHLHCGLVEGDWGESWRGAETLLGTAVANVDAPLVHLHIVAAERGYGVDDGEGAVAVDDVDDLGHRREDAGGGLGVDDANGLDAGMLRQLVTEGLWVYWLAPGSVDFVDDGAAPLGDVAEPDSEVAIAADNKSVAALKDVGAGSLHGAGAGGGHGHGQHVVSVIDLAQHVADIVHDLEEIGVQVAHHG